jgi:ferredoxin-nitrate reductase
MGDPFARYQGTTPVNILKVADLALATAGRLTPELGRTEELVFVDEALRTYKRVLIENDRVVGVLLLGEKGEFPALKALIDSGQELGETRRTLLRSGAPLPQGTGRVICSCQTVRESVLHDAVAAGAADVVALMAATGAGTGCGSCRPELARLCARGRGRL